MNGFLSQKVKNWSFVVETVVESKQNYVFASISYFH